MTGYVRDVSPYFLRSRIFVAPLRFGAGMKGKIGQALSYALPVVTTPVGAEGLGLRDGENAVIADADPQAFARSNRFTLRRRRAMAAYFRRRRVNAAAVFARNRRGPTAGVARADLRAADGLAFEPESREHRVELTARRGRRKARRDRAARSR